MSKPHPTEGAEIYTGCGIPRCHKAFSAVCTSLCAGRCARCLCCLLFRCCLDFSFSACIGKSQGARDSMHATGLLSSSRSGVDGAAGHATLHGLPLRSVVSDLNTTRTTLPLLRFFAATSATLSNRSVVSAESRLCFLFRHNKYIRIFLFVPTQTKSQIDQKI